jgi:hypothetical protein
VTDPVALVRTRLLALSAVTALTGTKITAGILRQGVVLPAVSVQLAGRVQDSHLRGSNRLMKADVRVYCVASTREVALAVANAADGDGLGSGLSHFQGTIGGVRVAAILPTDLENEDYRAGELKEYEVMREYTVHFER